VCNGPPKLRYWGCQSATTAMRGCSWAEVVFLTCASLTKQRAACASESDSITLAGAVSQRTLNAASLCVKVESIKILTGRPALNWPCAVFTSRVITPSDVTVETGACSSFPVRWSGSERGMHTHARGRDAALGSMTVSAVSAAACGCQRSNKARLSRPADHSLVFENFE